MDSQFQPLDRDGPSQAIAFSGTWREYLPIAASNVALTIVTLGIYRFWATARQRRYLWSRTRFIDDHLEWTGTGREMFFGFLIVVAILLPVFLFTQFLFPALIARGKESAAIGVFTLFYIGFFYLAGFARFRALRYRLSRTWWHGIRGGSDSPGWNFAGEWLGRYALTGMTMFIVFPWAVTRLWGAKWNRMSFGSLPFSAQLDAAGLKRRWALLYAVPVLGLALIFAAAATSLVAPDESAGAIGLSGIVVATLVIFYVGIPLATLAFFAKFYRKAAKSTRLGTLGFSFDARTWDWLKLILGNFALAVVTLGFGIAYWGYRNWSFMVRHLRVHGELDAALVGQSATAAPREAEGFADAFDVGAI